MCGRSVHAGRKSVIDTFRVRYFMGDTNVEMQMRPGQEILGLYHEDDKTVGTSFTWGTTVNRAEGPSLVYNARLETVGEKKMWETSWWDKRRIIIPVSRFMEGRLWFEHKERKPLAIAGLDSGQEGWGNDNSASSPFPAEAVMLTTAACKPVSPSYHRMPVLLTEDLWPLWLELKDVTKEDLLASSLVVALDELKMVT